MNKKDIKVMAFLAYKNIAKSKSTFVVIAAVMAMSFLSVTFFAAIIEGIGYEFEEGMIEGLTGHLMVEPTDEENHIQNSNHLAEKIKRIPDVKGVSQRIETNGVMTYENTELGAPFIFIEPTEERSVSNFHKNMVIGEFLSPKDTNEIIMGSNLIESYASEDDTQKRLDVNVGDTVKVSFSNGVVKEYKLKGIFETGLRFSDDKVLINMNEYEKVFGEKDIASEILVSLPERGNEKYYKQKIKELGVSEQVNIWQTKMGAVKQFVGSLQITNKITGFIGLLTAFATIYIIIFINVTHKRKQIGILKAVGVKKEIILGSYVMQSIAYGITGVIVGNILMQIILMFFTNYPLNMPMGDVVPLMTMERSIITSITLIFASMVAGYFPSRTAANDNILDAVFGG